VTDQSIPRKVIVLALTPAEAKLIVRALERMPKTNGGGEPQLREQVLQMLEGADFSARELTELSAIGAE
jgi:hypothetical protein